MTYHPPLGSHYHKMCVAVKLDFGEGERRKLWVGSPEHQSAAREGAAAHLLGPPGRGRAWPGAPHPQTR